ncbi:MAG: hypothetical protein ACFFCE_17675 [Promethearchaeota archaeon]
MEVIIINTNQNELNGYNCPCPKKGCKNHGNCDECIKYHSFSKNLPFCQRKHGFFTKIFYHKNYEMVKILNGGRKV